MSALGKVAVGLVAIYGAGVVVGLVRKAPLRQVLAWPAMIPYVAAGVLSEHGIFLRERTVTPNVPIVAPPR